jgi:hypothetical protein
MDIPSRDPAGRGLQPEDLALLAAIRGGNDWLRAVLCTVARRGIAFRLADPERARQIILILSPLPIYKGGQFLFDLMEWEDFMLDGPIPEPVPTTLDARSLVRIAALLDSIRGHLDGAFPGGIVGALKVEVQPSTGENTHEELPPLEGGFYLYQDVVLGLLQSAAPLIQASVPKAPAND